MRSGRVREVQSSPCLAWFWSPLADFLIYVVVDGPNNCLQWYRVWVNGGEPQALGSFWPTRDMLFFLHFFDQYATSHSPISADGRWLCWAGYPAGGGQADLSGAPQIYVRDLDSDEAAPAIADGSFAVFGPAPPHS